MSHTNTHPESAHDDAALLASIDRSALLNATQKEQAKEFASRAGASERQALSTLLDTEPGVVQTMVQRTVQNAAQEGSGADVTQQLDGFFRQAGKFLRESGEHAERQTETESAEKLLDAA